jgi:hypothetical protein
MSPYMPNIRPWTKIFDDWEMVVQDQVKSSMEAISPINRALPGSLQHRCRNFLESMLFLRGGQLHIQPDRVTSTRRIWPASLHELGKRATYRTRTS